MAIKARQKAKSRKTKKTTTKRNPSKSSKKYIPPKYFNLDEAASSLSMSISEIIDYGVRGLLTIQTLTLQGDFIAVPSEDLNRFVVNPDDVIDISKLRRPFNYYQEYYGAPPDTNCPIKIVVSMKTLRIHEKEFTRFKKQLKSKNIKGKVKKSKSKKKEIDNFNDVKLKMIVDWKGNYSDSDYKFFVKHKKSSKYKELKLADRFKPVLYRLVKGVMKAKRPTDYVPNKELLKSFSPREDIDDAKKEIKKVFVKSIGSRVKNIVRIERKKGKQLMIPKRNITLDEKGNPPF